MKTTDFEKNNSKKGESFAKKPFTSKQAVAMGGIILLVLLYVVTLIVAIADTSASGHLFAACLFATLAVPVLIWIYTWMYGKLSGRKTFADFYTDQTDSDEDSENTKPR